MYGKCFWHAFCVVLGPLAENIYMHQWTHLKTNAEKHFKLWAISGTVGCFKNEKKKQKIKKAKRGNKGARKKLLPGAVLILMH